MNIKSAIINQFAKLVLGWAIKKISSGEVFESAKKVVLAAEGTGRDGNYKWKYAVTEFKKYGYELLDFVVEFALTMAVTWLQAEQGKLK